MSEPIIAIIVGLVIFFVAREIMCWYWRIHERVNNQEKQIELLEDILLKLEQIDRKIETNKKNDESTPI